MTSLGFVINNERCIGCHACTVACKAEHDVPVGVFRTWVKYIEKGTYPHTRRIFSVLRCNHCDNPPCVTICPVMALFKRDDGIVDFDGSRCIGCKACMQACPYDALYIDPRTFTSAKCNFCSNRIEIGLQPACVIICPEQAIVVGDLHDPSSEISQLVAKRDIIVRKPEKGTTPKLFYIEGDTAMLTPSATSRSKEYVWSQQSEGIGHFTGKETNFTDLSETNEETDPNRRVYDIPSKGRLWGWEVPAYILTKSIATGIGLILGFLYFFGAQFSPNYLLVSGGIALLSLIATGIFLIIDLDQPLRFHTIFLRPQWKSWLTRGALLITLFGGVLSVFILREIVPQLQLLIPETTILLIILGILTSVYTAFLLAQAKGRDFWQSPILPFEKLAFSLLTGSAILLVLNLIGFNLSESDASWYLLWLPFILIGSALTSLVLGLVEIFFVHSTSDAAKVATSLRQGKWAFSYWSGLFLSGILPFFYLSGQIWLQIPVLLVTIIGVYMLTRAWIFAPQDVALA